MSSFAMLDVIDFSSTVPFAVAAAFGLLFAKLLQLLYIRPASSPLKRLAAPKGVSWLTGKVKGERFLPETYLFRAPTRVFEPPSRRIP